MKIHLRQKGREGRYRDIQKQLVCTSYSEAIVVKVDRIKSSKMEINSL